MSQGEEPRARAAWGEARWQPEADVAPMPVQRQPADPLVPGWGIGEPPGMPVTAGPLPLRPPDEPAGRADRTIVWVVAGAVVVGILVFVGVAVGGRLVARSVQHQVDTVTNARVSTQLISAGEAITLYRAQTGANPTDLTTLGEYGFRPSSDVTVQLLPASSGYCLAGGPVGRAPTAWYSDTGGLASKPCG